MSPKKTPDVSAKSVEAEIALLAGETSGASSSAPASSADSASMQSMFASFMKTQQQQNDMLMRQGQALLSAVRQVASNPQQVRSVPACSSQSEVPQHSLHPDNLDSSEAPMGDWEDVEEEGLDEEDYDFEGWSLPLSGSVSGVEVDPAVVASTPGGSADPQSLDEDLFNVYGLQENWTLAQPLVSWLCGAVNKTVPKEVLKDLNELHVPAPDAQPVFVAPVLPAAMNRILYTAPKSRLVVFVEF